MLHIYIYIYIYVYDISRLRVNAHTSGNETSLFLEMFSSLLGGGAVEVSVTTAI